MKRLAKQFRGDGVKAQLLRGTGGSAVVQAANILLALAAGVVLARTLGPESYGTYTFVLSIVTLLSLPAKAGLPTLLVREIAKNQVKRQWGLLRGILKFSNGLALGYATVVAAAGSGLVLSGVILGNSASATSFAWGLWLLPLMALEATRTASLRGLRWVVTAQLPEKIVRPALMIVLVGGAAITGTTLNPDTALQFQLVGAFVAFLVGAFVLVKALPRDVTNAIPEYAVRPWLASLAPLTFFVGLKLLDSQVAIIFLGFLSTPEDVGLFKVAATGAGLVTFSLMAVNMALAPQLARLYNAGEKEKLQRVVTLSVRAVCAISLPVALVLIVWGEPIVGFVFGNEYSGAADALAILCIGQLINTSAGSVGAVLSMTGNDQLVFIGALLALTVNTVLALVLIPAYGLTGAAVSFAVSISTWNIFLSIMAWSKLGINTYLK